MSLESLIMAVVGLIVGFLASYAVFAGRMATLEANSKTMTDRLDRIEHQLVFIVEQLARLTGNAVPDYTPILRDRDRIRR